MLGPPPPLRKDSTRSLYRALLRLVNKLDIATFKFAKSSDLAILLEHEKYTLQPLQYLQQVKFELKYNLNREFRVRYENPDSLMFAYLKGVDLLQCFTGDLLVKKLIEYRNDQFQRQQWRYQSLELSKSRSSPRVSSRTAKSASSTTFTPLTLSEKSKRYKRSMRNARTNSLHLLIRHIKKLQASGDLPVPHKLPYTPDKQVCAPDLTSKIELEIDRPTPYKTIAAAYDVQYVNSIIKSGLSFDINKFHYLDNLRYIVNEKGPLAVKIGITNGGPIAIPYIRMPYPRIRHLKEVAMDMKKSLTLFRLRNVWESYPQGAMEKQVKDGSIIIHGVPMFPKSYYLDLAAGEALWECLMDLKTRNGPAMTQEQKEALLLRYESEWKEFVRYTSDSLNRQIQRYENKYSLLRSDKSKLLSTRDRLQREQNQYYNKMIKQYQEVVSNLQKFHIHKHSEIVNGDKNSEQYSEDLLYNGDIGNTRGIAEQERLGMGKTIADYLRQAGYKSFRFGEKFYDRFKF